MHALLLVIALSATPPIEMPPLPDLEGVDHRDALIRDTERLVGIVKARSKVALNDAGLACLWAKILVGTTGGMIRIILRATSQFDIEPAPATLASVKTLIASHERAEEIERDRCRPPSASSGAEAWQWIVDHPEVHGGGPVVNLVPAELARRRAGAQAAALLWGAALGGAAAALGPEMIPVGLRLAPAL